MLDGDDSPYHRYKAEQFSSRFLPRISVEWLSYARCGVVGWGGPCGGWPITTIRSDWLDVIKRRRWSSWPSAMSLVPEIVLSDSESLPFADKELDRGDHRDGAPAQPRRTSGEIARRDLSSQQGRGSALRGHLIGNAGSGKGSRAVPELLRVDWLVGMVGACAGHKGSTS